MRENLNGTFVALICVLSLLTTILNLSVIFVSNLVSLYTFQT